ncbi:MAG: heavy-metal-associated domain-containing protein, partial [Propionibacteriaceae bacterium]
PQVIPVTMYTVTGMTCGRCVAHVTEEIETLAGVTNVSVQLDGAMSITSEQALPLADVVASVAEAGNYTVVEN